MRRPAVALATLVALLAAGCGGDDLTPEDEVRAVVTKFGTATAKKDYQAICDDLFARALADNTEQYGLPCELALKQGFDAVRAPRLTIRAITVKDDVARVRVRSTAANQPASEDVLRLERDGGAWRITSLG